MDVDWLLTLTFQSFGKSQVHSAKNLRPADVNGLADPFCASQLQGENHWVAPIGYQKCSRFVGLQLVT